MNIFEQATSLLACPKRCAGQLHFEGTHFTCPGCQARYAVRGRIVDFIPEIGPSQSRAQRVMENKWIAKIYEDHWRPWFTSLGGQLDYEQEESWLRLHHVLEAEGPVLDLACGTGRYARLFARARKQSLVFGVDLSMPMLEQAAEVAAKQGLSNLLFLRATAEHLPLRDARISLLNCFGALHLFPNIPRALDELGRVASDGAVFTCLTARKQEVAGKAFVQRVFSRVASFEFFEEKSLAAQLEQAGFVDYAPTRYDSLLLFRVTRQARARG